MAKGKPKVWLVRDEICGAAYIIASPARGKPTKNKHGTWTGLGRLPHWIEHVQFEWLFPHRLPEGGGPVLIEFKETT